MKIRGFVLLAVFMIAAVFGIVQLHGLAKVLYLTALAVVYALVVWILHSKVKNSSTEPAARRDRGSP